MDENSSPVSTPGSTNSSPTHHTTYELVSPLQAKTNKTRYEALSDPKKPATLSSPVRSPLSDKNTSTLISPQYHVKQRHTPPLLTKQSPSVSKQQQQPVKRTTVTISEPPATTPTNAPATTITSPSPRPPSIDRSTEIRALRQELDDLTSKLKAERQHSTTLTKWEKDMTALTQEFKEIQLDVDDMVDILVEYDQVEADLINDKQTEDEETQKRIDILMNAVPERIYQIEELKQLLNE